SGKQVLLLGAGGAARAVLAALIPENPKGITLAVRSLEKAQAILEVAEQIKTPLGSVSQVDLRLLSTVQTLEPYTLLVNTTPTGMYPHAVESPHPLTLLDTLPTG